MRKLLISLLVIVGLIGLLTSGLHLSSSSFSSSSESKASVTTSEFSEVGLDPRTVSLMWGLHAGSSSAIIISGLFSAVNIKMRSLFYNSSSIGWSMFAALVTGLEISFGIFFKDSFVLTMAIITLMSSLANICCCYKQRKHLANSITLSDLQQMGEQEFWG